MRSSSPTTSEIVVERCHDLALIRSILTHPRIFPHMHDDFEVSREEWQPSVDERVMYVVGTFEGKPVGICIVVALSAVCWEIHQAFLPEFRGPIARRAAVTFRDWLWSTFQRIQRIEGKIPAYNKLAILFAKEFGMEEYGVSKASFMKHGRLQDLVCLGMCRPASLGASDSLDRSPVR